MKKYILLTSIILPGIASAQTIFSVWNVLIELIDKILPLLVGAAVIVFLWNLVRYIIEVESAEKKKELGSYIPWSLGVLFVTVSVWGIVSVILATFGIDPDGGRQGGAAGPSGGITDYASLAAFATNALNNYIVPLLIGIALVYFMLGLVRYLSSGGNSQVRAESVQAISYGLVALAIIISVNVLVGIVTNTFFGIGADIPQL